MRKLGFALNDAFSDSKLREWALAIEEAKAFPPDCRWG